MRVGSWSPTTYAGSHSTGGGFPAGTAPPLLTYTSCQANDSCLKTIWLDSTRRQPNPELLLRSADCSDLNMRQLRAKGSGWCSTSLPNPVQWGLTVQPRTGYSQWKSLDYIVRWSRIGLFWPCFYTILSICTEYIAWILLYIIWRSLRNLEEGISSFLLTQESVSRRRLDCPRLICWLYFSPRFDELFVCHDVLFQSYNFIRHHPIYPSHRLWGVWILPLAVRWLFRRIIIGRRLGHGRVRPIWSRFCTIPSLRGISTPRSMQLSGRQCLLGRIG